MKAGSIRFCVMSRNATNEPNRPIAASVGLAIPKDSQQYGYLSEHHSFGDTEEKAGDYAEDLAATMLATTLGIEFDSSKDWDERKNNIKPAENSSLLPMLPNRPKGTKTDCGRRFSLPPYLSWRGNSR